MQTHRSPLYEAPSSVAGSFFAILINQGDSRKIMAQLPIA
jgi:hypothetical protein